MASIRGWSRARAIGLHFALCASSLAGCKAFDPIAEIPPGSMFTVCCGELGSCIAEGLLPSAYAAKLSRDVCAAALLCAPRVYLEAPTLSLAACRTAGDIEGRCMSTCLPDVASLIGRLQQRSCASSELCVPCFDPVSGRDTEACRVGNDAAREPARIFERCCGSGDEAGGVCVSADWLSADQAAALRADMCSDGTSLCVPIPLVSADGLFPRCMANATDTAARACVRDCFLGARLGGFVPRGSCDENARCAPCTSLSQIGGCP